jgi:hypothetical protein
MTAGAATEAATTVSRDGWTIAADVPRGVLSISHERLGPVLTVTEFALRGRQGLRPLRTWSVEKAGPDQLSVTTEEPHTRWVFEPRENGLIVLSTSADSVLMGKASASKDRPVARLLDPQGVPVEWTGTGEVAANYQGSWTRNRSFLPRRNPECMYFALGRVASPLFHSLFDRKTDTAIQFTEETILDRDCACPVQLNVTMPVPGSAMVRLVPDYYTKTLGLPFYAPSDDAHFSTAPMVWCSWGSYYSMITESDMVRNVDSIAEKLKPYGFQYVQLDDGYDRGPGGSHCWIENWDRKKFPHGPQWLVGYIKSKGLHPGLWIVPNAYAGAVQSHPDWYLRDKEGKIILVYDTPALDCTHPGTRAFLKRLFTTLGQWGFEYYKFDGEHALAKSVPAVDKTRLYDKSVDPIVAYRKRLELIRETIGPKVFVEACPSGTPLNGIGYVNSYFNGEDDYNNWQGMHSLLSSLKGNAFLNHFVTYVMPGEGLEVGPQITVEEAMRKRPREVMDTVRGREAPLTGLGVTTAEARTLVSCVALSGVVYSLASVVPELPPERLLLLQKTLPTMPILPVDLFSRGSGVGWDTFKSTRPDDCIFHYPEIIDLKVSAASGIYDVVGVVNWRSTPVVKSLSLADKLGLRPGFRYVVFDFWNQKVLGVVHDSIELAIGPHDTRVLQIHPLLTRPQLVGTSRHISGAWSIKELSWDTSRNTLRGSSETVPGETYTLFVYLPQGTMLAGVRAIRRSGPELAVHHELEGNVLTVTFQGQREPVDWHVEHSQVPN